MGGRGSGRRIGWTKPYCEDYLQLDIRKIARAGRLEPEQLFSWQWTRRHGSSSNIIIRVYENDSVELIYNVKSDGEDSKHIEDCIDIEWTNCHYGGQRPWWVCPDCGRRVAVLYGGEYFRCRKCYALAYACQSETQHDRLLRKTHKFKHKLGEHLTRPKGMHWGTYERLKARAIKLEEAKDLSFLAIVGKRWPDMVKRLRA